MFQSSMECTHHFNLVAAITIRQKFACERIHTVSKQFKNFFCSINVHGNLLYSYKRQLLFKSIPVYHGSANLTL